MTFYILVPMNCLVFRFSAMGDVALTVPVLRSALEQNPSLKITMVSNKAFEPFFHDLPNFEFYGVTLKDYNGTTGLYRLYKELNKHQKWDAVLDIHSVMRTWVLGTFFKWRRIPVYKIDKGREAKKALTRKKKKQLVQLPHTTERYAKVFTQAGIKLNLNFGEAIHSSKPLPNLTLDSSLLWIGIAPFSKHQQKEWPLDKVKELIGQLSKLSKFEILLLGGGSKEKEILEKLCSPYKNVHSLVGKFSLSEEITLVKKLSLLVSMDSFNLHLATLLGVKVVSIWGATHSFAGFGPVGENNAYQVEIPAKELECRPCSIFGSKPCHRGDFACMQQISVEMVMEKINFALNS
ncbi:ADP-heptose:LPS heptosyltransferase [hydrothermal vent metagenome]|uniref:ADP-heptose:LPS heptosyltransferase n=1 Tax=hydrothermal vent metagenome TaxID=652676 RepID=A0A3B0U5V0_9ZZZZ